MFRSLIAFTLTLLMTFLYGSYTNSQESPLMGVWLTNVDSEVLFSKKKTQEAINTLASLNFNTIYPTVWNWGYTLYPSEVAKTVIGINIDPTPGLQGRDMLQEITTEAHKKGIAVIPWFEFGFMAPEDSLLAKRYPQWLTQRQDGSTMWLEGNVHRRVWLNPLNPEVQKLITHLVLEIVNQHDTEGIQFDDHFGYPSDFGYDPFTVNLYKQEHQGSSPPKDYKDTAWVQWRADKITQYLKTLRDTIKKINPKAIISVSPNPQDFSLNSYLLDWQAWEEGGLVDELVLQVYRSNIGDFRREITQSEVIAAQSRIPVGIGVLAGLKGRPVTLSTIKEQVKLVREKRFDGVSFFFYESVFNFGPESLAERQMGFKEIFN